MTKRRMSVSVDKPYIIVIDKEEYAFPTGVGAIPNSLTLQSHLTDIDKAIAQKDADTLQSQLSCLMQCSPITAWLEGEFEEGIETPSRFEERERGVPEEATTFYLNACPVIEGIARLYPYSIFPNLVDKLIAAKDEGLYNALGKSFESTLGTMLSSNLYAWNLPISAALASQITEIENYGIKLSNRKDEPSRHKGKIMKDLAVQLRERVTTFSKTFDTTAPEFCKNLQVLQFKLKFNETLHSQDQELGKHRGYAKIISNLFSILFTGGILNVVNYARTGNFWLYSKTASQERIAQVESTVGPLLKVR